MVYIKCNLIYYNCIIFCSRLEYSSFWLKYNFSDVRNPPDDIIRNCRYATCKILFWIPVWGNRKRAALEKFDDGNTTNGDGCSYNGRFSYSSTVNGSKFVEFKSIKL